MKGLRSALAPGVKGTQPYPDLHIRSLFATTNAHAHDFGHSHELLVVPLEGFGGSLLSLTQKHRNVEEADLQQASLLTD